ncbi:hypothetical protein TIFTF001_040206 [Ficus carica]|uniref:Uncharacterized protein n=1 Tax=Ficus carica TaxID=3494 RepID=A0AA87ZA20_FICCA|nr:hypothetical protein TIFTF001_040206 [Ficus carica]
MVWERNMGGFCGRVFWLVNGKLWGMASVRFCGYGVVKGGWRSRNHNMLENGFLLQCLGLKVSIWGENSVVFLGGGSHDILLVPTMVASGGGRTLPQTVLMWSRKVALVMVA